MNYVLGVEYEYDISPHGTILELKKMIEEDTETNIDDLELSREEALEEAWPSDNELPLQKDGKGVRDGETLILTLPKASQRRSQKNIKLNNATDEKLEAEVLYETRNVYKESDIRCAVSVDASLSVLGACGGGGGSMEINKTARVYETHQSNQKGITLYPHKINKIPISDHLYNVVNVKILRKNSDEVERMEVIPGSAKIISSNPETGDILIEDRIKARFWGVSEWMPVEGASKDPHLTMNESDGPCKVCGFKKRNGVNPKSFISYHNLVS